MGSESIRPSGSTGEGRPPKTESKPFREKISRRPGHPAAMAQAAQPAPGLIPTRLILRQLGPGGHAEDPRTSPHCRQRLKIRASLTRFRQRDSRCAPRAAMRYVRTRDRWALRSSTTPGSGVSTAHGQLPTVRSRRRWPTNLLLRLDTEGQPPRLRQPHTYPPFGAHLGRTIWRETVYIKVVLCTVPATAMACCSSSGHDPQRR